jgi:hypothetical protein
MLLSTVDPELERSLETIAAKAKAKVRAKSSAGKVCKATFDSNTSVAIGTSTHSTVHSQGAVLM